MSAPDDPNQRLTADDVRLVPEAQQIVRDHLLHLMREESEDRWAASWLIDLEFILWEEGGKWHELAALAGGWWMWPDDFVPLEEWEQLFATYEAERGEHIDGQEDAC